MSQKRLPENKQSKLRILQKQSEKRASKYQKNPKEKFLIIFQIQLINQDMHGHILGKTKVKKDPSYKLFKKMI